MVASSASLPLCRVWRGALFTQMSYSGSVSFKNDCWRHLLSHGWVDLNAKDDLTETIMVGRQMEEPKTVDGRRIFSPRRIQFSEDFLIVRFNLQLSK